MGGNEAQAEFLRRLAAIEFGVRYYEFCDRDGSAAPVPSSPSSRRPDDVARALATTGLRFRYDRRGHVYGHRRFCGAGEIYLNVAPGRNEIVLSSGLVTPDDVFGGAFHRLAHRCVGQERPGWRPDPPCPPLPAVGRAGLGAALRFGLDLHHDLCAVGRSVADDHAR